MAHTEPMSIHRGSAVEVTTANGDQIVMRALGQPIRGRDFPVVWVCTDEEYERAESAGDEADGLPWPLDALHELETA
jgi:hypothetical protein